VTTTVAQRRAWYKTPAGKASQLRSNKRLLLRNRLAWQWVLENHPEQAQQIINTTNEQIGDK
jgi:hypothetical protein